MPTKRSLRNAMLLATALALSPHLRGESSAAETNTAPPAAAREAATHDSKEGGTSVLAGVLAGSFTAALAAAAIAWGFRKENRGPGIIRPDDDSPL